MSTPNHPNDKADFWAGTPSRDQGSQRPEPASVTDESSPRKPAGRGLSITAIWLSALTLLLAIPWPVLSAIPSLVGLPFAIIGLKRSRTKNALAITALVVSIVTLVLGGFLTILYFRMITGLGL